MEITVALIWRGKKTTQMIKFKIFKNPHIWLNFKILNNISSLDTFCYLKLGVIIISFNVKKNPKQQKTQN